VAGAPAFGSPGGVRYIAKKVAPVVTNHAKRLHAWLRLASTRTVGAVRGDAFGCGEFY